LIGCEKLPVVVATGGQVSSAVLGVLLVLPR
jgi:hypothetical protein